MQSRKKVNHLGEKIFHPYHTIMFAFITAKTMLSKLSIYLKYILANEKITCMRYLILPLLEGVVLTFDMKTMRVQRKKSRSNRMTL